MGVRVLVGATDEAGEDLAACLYDSTTMSVLGPLMQFDEKSDAAELRQLAEGYADFVEDQTGKDPRRVPDAELHKLYVRYLASFAPEPEKTAGNGEAAKETV